MTDREALAEMLKKHEFTSRDGTVVQGSTYAVIDAILAALPPGDERDLTPREETLIQKALLASGTPITPPSDVREKVVEECAAICDSISIAAERRGADHPPQSNAQSAAYDKAESAARCARAIRALSPLPAADMEKGGASCAHQRGIEAD